MNSTSLLRLSKRIATSQGYKNQLRTRPQSRNYAENYSNSTKKNPNLESNNNLLLAGGAAVVLAGVIGISQPWSWMLATKAGDTGDNKKTPWTTDGGDRTSLKEPGIQPNSTSTEGSQDASQTTGANSKKGNTIERYPDAKGGNKKRIVSNAGMKQGAIDKAPREGYEGVDDPAAASKPPGGAGTTSGKQEGLSNTDTKYSIDLTNNPNKSRKGEGTPETSKSKGTVDVNRPLA